MLEASGGVDELASGLYRVGSKNVGDLTCVVTRAAGTAPARLVCGRHDKDVLALAPYMARNLPMGAPPTSDVHAEVRWRPIEARYVGRLRLLLNFLPEFARSEGIQEPRFDAALVDAATGLAVEASDLAAELD